MKCIKLMLICENFLFLHIPKTGSTFVRTVLTEIYRRRARQNSSAFQPVELILNNPNVQGRPPDQHGTFRQIPEYAKSHLVVSVARNLYGKFRSTFEYRYWAEHPSLPRDELLGYFPHFPDLTIDEYVEMNILAGHRKVPGGNPLGIGNQTIQFIRMYFRDPIGVLERLNADYVDGLSMEYKRDMPSVLFLRHEKLNDELARFLEKMGFSEEEAEFCRTHPKVNVGSASVEVPCDFPPASVSTYIQSHERFLIRMLANEGIDCAAVQW